METDFINELAKVLLGTVKQGLDDEQGIKFFQEILRSVLQIPTVPTVPQTLFAHWTSKTVGPREISKELTYKDETVVITLDLKITYERKTTQTCALWYRTCESEVTLKIDVTAYSILMENFPKIRERYRTFFRSRATTTKAMNEMEATNQENMFNESFGARQEN